MDAIEKRALDQLAQLLQSGGFEGELRVGREFGKALVAEIAALTPPEGSDQNLLELAATFETCIAFLPPAGRRNIAKAVDQLRYKGMTTAEGHVVVTRNEAGQAVAVTRQDDEGRILSVIAELEMPSGYMLVPVGQDPVDFYVCDACGHHYMEDGVTCDCTPDAVQPPLRHVCMISARPEVP